MQTLNFKWSIYNVSLNETDAIDLLKDQNFLTDALLMCLDREACDKSYDFLIEFDGLKDKLMRHYEKMQFNMEFVSPILDRLDKI
jgi:hypothetical protein